MTARAAGGAGTPAPLPVTLVWIDSREAFIARWAEGGIPVEHLDSEVPAHRRSTGHVGHAPAIRHGGGGSAQDAGEGHRQEHLERWVEEIAELLPAHDALLVLGPGTTRERLVHRLEEADRRMRRDRTVRTEAAGPLTEARLTERLRAENGAPAARHAATVRG